MNFAQARLGTIVNFDPTERTVTELFQLTLNESDLDEPLDPSDPRENHASVDIFYSWNRSLNGAIYGLGAKAEVDAETDQTLVLQNLKTRSIKNPITTINAQTNQGFLIAQLHQPRSKSTFIAIVSKVYLADSMGVYERGDLNLDIETPRSTPLRGGSIEFRTKSAGRLRINNGAPLLCMLPLTLNQAQTSVLVDEMSIRNLYPKGSSDTQ